MDFKRQLAGPFEFLKAEGLATTGTPPTVAAASVKMTFGIHAPADEAAGEAGAERNDGSLFDAVDGFEKDAADVAVALVGNEHLLLEGAKLAAGFIAEDEGGGVADLAVDEIHGGRKQLLDAFALGDDAVGIAIRIGFTALAVALESFGDGIERTRAHVGG